MRVPFEIAVTSLAEALTRIESGWPTRIVSLLTDDITVMGAHHSVHRFDDVNRPIKGWIHPTPEHLIAILDFTKDLTQDDKLLVHCSAGISRSTAVAIGILIQHGMNYRDAFSYMAKLQPILLPNSLLIKYIDNHANLDGVLIRLVERHAVAVKRRNLAGLLPRFFPLSKQTKQTENDP